MNNFKERSLTAIVFVAILLAGLLINEYIAAVLFATIIFIGTNEFFRFFKLSEVSPQVNFGIIGSLLFFFINVSTLQLGIPIKTFLLLVPFIFLSFIRELYRKKKNPIGNIAFTLLGIIYISVPFTFLYEMFYFPLRLEGQEYDSSIVLGYFFILWANDTGAYLVGRQFGKHKLFESISPKKTWEGFIGGAVLAVVMGYFNGIMFPMLEITHWLVIATLIFIFGTLGDLVESMMKRSLNLKDSGNILPGHGGVLDRFDGILISAPMVYTYLNYISL